MEKKERKEYEELIPSEGHYLTDLDHTMILDGICATKIDETQYIEITKEEAEEILAQLNSEVDQNDKN